MKTRFPSWISSLAALGLALLSVRAAHARDCASTSDCPRGFSCEPSGAAATGAPAGTCVSTSCQSDADCGAGLRCYLDYGTECTGPAGQQTCGPASACVPQWQAPCETDGDCGPGFTCGNQGASYECGRNQGQNEPPYATTMTVPCEDVPKPPIPPCPTDGSCPFQFPWICDAGSTCTEVKVKSCIQQMTAPCTADSDCPSTWTCQCPMNDGSRPEVPAGDASVEVGDAACTKACVPPNSDLGFFEGADGPGGAVSFGPAGSGGTTSPADSGGVIVSGKGATAGASAPPATASGGGCAIGADETGAEWAWGTLAALACAAGLRSRRRAGR